MERKSRKQLKGVVVSTKMDKTIIVEVTRYKKDQLYHKRFKRTKNFAAHDEKNIAKIGDKVSIVETRPLSKTKHFHLSKILIGIDKEIE